jgi:hypothetical protein
MSNGLINIYPHKNYLRKSIQVSSLEIIKINKKIIDEEIYNEYLPAILKARELFGNPQIVNNINEIYQNC